MTKQKSILLIGVGEIGLNQIRWAQEAGFTVTVTDRSPTAPSISIADDHIIVDGADSLGIIRALLQKDPDNLPDAVYTGNDFGIVSAAVIAQSLGLSGCPVSAAVASIDKILMKQAWERQAIQTPKFELISETDRIEPEDFQLPAVVKPASASGSQGVVIVRETDDLPRAVTEARRFSNGTPVLVEQFIEGQHVDANGIFWQGEFFPCGTARRYFTAPPTSVPLWGHDPASIPAGTEHEIYRIFEAASRSLGIDNSPVKADFIIAEGKPFIIELSARFHGDLGLSHNTYYRTGSSPARIYYETLMTGEVPEKTLREVLNSNRISGWSVIKLKPGRITNLDAALRRVRADIQVDNVYVDPRRGNEFRRLKNNDDVNGFIWVSGYSLEEIEQRLNQFNQHLQEEVEYE